MKRRLAQLAIGVAGFVVATLVSAHPAAAYSNTRLMDDAIFDNVNSMSEQQIRTFINSRPSSCLAQSGAMFPEPISYWQYGGNVDAARVVYNAAQYNGINPQVILATLQKEQSLITRTNCFEGTSSVDSRNKAMGQGCPDGGACPAPAYAGFHQQVMKGAWQLKFNKERAVGNVEWGDNGSIVYPEPYTEGNRKNCSTCSVIYRDGYKSIDGQMVRLETGATASFYRYTPHLGQALPGIFEGWFGPTLVPTYGWQFVGQTASRDLSQMPAGEFATFTVTAKNTGSTTWTKNGANPVRLGTSHAQDRNSAFASSTWLSPSRPAAMNETSVAPGSNATFTFTVQAPNTPGTYNEYFNLVMEGVTWFNDPGLQFMVSVVPPQLTSTVLSTNQPTTVLTDSDTTVTATVKNTGNVTWYKTGRYPVRLGTCSPLERSSAFADQSWPLANRPANMNETSVAPNGTATFTFHLKAPHVPVQTTENFCTLAEGHTWFGQTVAVPMDVRGTYQAASTASPTVSLVAGDVTTVSLTFTNLGTATWQNSGPTPVKLGTAEARDRTSGFYDSGWNGPTRPAFMTEASVAPGSTGTFTFTVRSQGTQRGTYREQFLPVAEGQEWFGSTGTVTVNVVAPVYSWAPVGQAAYTDASKATPLDLGAVSPGQAGWLVVQAKNTGNVTWNKGGANPVRIGTETPKERVSRFNTGAWLNNRRPGGLSETTVAPNGTGTFEFPIQVPPGGGTFIEHFNLLAENLVWMNDTGLSFYTKVNQGYSWSLESQYAYTNSGKTAQADLSNLSPGQTVFIGFTARNTGTATWYRGGPAQVNLGTSQPLDRPSAFANGSWLGPNRPVALREASVAPGQVGTFEFTYTAPNRTGTFYEYFTPVAEGITWMNNIGLNFYTVVR